MALPVLNPGINNLDPNSALYALYTRYYENITSANDCDSPDFAPLDGEVDAEGNLSEAYHTRVEASLASYKEVQMRNAAYNSAVAVLSSIGDPSNPGGGSGSGFVARAGDSMLGLLQTKYGFEAGYGGTKIFDTTIIAEDNANVNLAHVYGRLLVDDDASVTGKITLGDDGVYFGADQTLFKDSGGKIVLKGANVKLDGAVQSTGSITVGNVVISSSAIHNGMNVYYHAGNANNQDVDWAADDMEVFGNLTVHGNQSFGGILSALHGFELGANNEVLFRSMEQTENDVTTTWLNLKSFIDLDSGTGLEYNGYPIVKAWRDSNNEYRVDFGAPAMKMYLGASDGDTLTGKIILASDIYNYADTFRIISRFGDGNFPNSLSAGCATSGPTVLQTYFGSQSDCGVVFQKLIRLNSANGPAISIGANEYEAKINLPYQHVVSDQNAVERLSLSLSFVNTTSLFRDLSKAWSATMVIDMDSGSAEFFRFAKPVEAGFFSINSETYKTKLDENILFFDDGVFLEGVTGGIFHSGNATFSGSVSSTTFASGFAGYGWAVKSDLLYGGYEATVDSLVVRKKMRVYELEVQKISVTNGSLWVSDACSGDSVTEIV